MRRLTTPALWVSLALGSVLILAQAWYSSLSTSRVLFEELGESVRNPVWFAHRLVYDGVSSNVGWYALVAAGYQWFGFSFVLPKVVRLVFHAISLACLWHLLSHAIGWRRALVPMAALGLSPTWLYFNTLGTTYGIDLQWAPVIGLLAWHAWDGSGTARLAVNAALGLTIMVACLMWPVCVFYVPLWIAVYGARAHAARAGSRRLPIALAIAGAALPILGLLVWLDNGATWLRDPATGSGAFRGGGNGLVDSPLRFAGNVARVVADATRSGNSYYFWLPRPDVSGVLALTTAAAVVAMLPAIWRRSAGMRIVLGAAIAVACGAVVVAGAVSGPPGLRRATIGLAVFYFLYVLAWRAATERLSASPPWGARAAVAALSLLLVHHLLALAPNARSLREPVPGTQSAWFDVAATPDEAVAHWERHLDSGGILDCRISPIADPSCRYAEIYAAIAARRRWSEGRGDSGILAYDLERRQTVPLTPEAWPFGSRR